VPLLLPCHPERCARPGFPTRAFRGSAGASRRICVSAAGLKPRCSCAVPEGTRISIAMPTQGLRPGLTSIPPLRGWLSATTVFCRKPRPPREGLVFSPQRLWGPLRCLRIMGREEAPSCVAARGHRNRNPAHGAVACRYDLDLERNTADAIALAIASSVQPLSSLPCGENNPGPGPKRLIPDRSTKGKSSPNGPNFPAKRHLCRFGTWGRNLPLDSLRKSQNLYVEMNSNPDILWMSRGKRYILYFTPVQPEPKE
jgi:hypothetical protein